jgi:hypothetical protein
MSNRFYGATALTGGGSGALDNIDGSILGDGDGAFVIDATNNITYVYTMDATSGAGVSSPDIIKPATNGGSMRWLLVDTRTDDLVTTKSLTITTTSELKGNVQIGDADGTGANLTIYSDTAGDHVVFDKTAKTLTLTDVSISATAAAFTTITGSGVLSVDDTTDSTSAVTGSIHTDGGLGVAKDVYFGNDLLIAATGVVNFGAGDVTITHSAAKLTLGGDGAVEIDFNNHEMTNVDIDSGDIAAGVTFNLTDSGGYFTNDVESAIQEIGLELLVHKLNGIEDASNWALASDAGTPPTITITFTGTVGWWSNGNRYTDSGTDNITIADTSGLHFIYYNDATLSELVNPTTSQIETMIKNNAFVCLVYWNTNDNTAPVLAYEWHGCVMSGETHLWLHNVLGTKWKTGGNLSAYTIATASDAALSFDLTNVTFFDEDIEHDVIDGAAATQMAQVLTGDAEIPVLYRDDTTGHWTEQAASTLPYISAVAGNNRLAYNNDDGDGTWSQVEVGNAKYVNYWLTFTNDWQYPVKMIQGTTEHASLVAAIDGINDELATITSYPVVELVFAYVFHMQTGTGTGGTKKATIERITDLRAEGITGAASAIATSDHGGLSGLGDDDHAQYLLADGTRALAGAWDMGSQNLTNVNVDGGSVDGAAIGAASASTIVGTTIDATTDFTVGGTVITDGGITDDGTLAISAATIVNFTNAGIIGVGSDGVQSGQVRSYGHAAGSTVGGRILVYTANDHDTYLNTFEFQAISDDLHIGPSTNSDALIFIGNGTNADPGGSWSFTVPVDVDAALTARC